MTLAQFIEDVEMLEDISDFHAAIRVVEQGRKRSNSGEFDRSLQRHEERPS